MSEKPFDGTTTLVSGGFGGICLAIAERIGTPYDGWLRFAAPWLTALVAAMWPNIWERFKWWRERKQAIKTLEVLIHDLQTRRAMIDDEQARSRADMARAKLEHELVRIHAARPLMDLTIDTSP
jgi:hypothetical protein